MFLQNIEYAHLSFMPLSLKVSIMSVSVCLQGINVHWKTKDNQRSLPHVARNEKLMKKTKTNTDEHEKPKRSENP